MGVVVRDTMGELIATMACPVKNIDDPRILEAIAIAQGIKLAKEILISGFTIESDCLGVVNQVNKSEEDLSAHGHLVQMIKEELKSPSCMGVTHVRREGNVPAHSLAKFACNIAECRVWIEEGLHV